MVEQLRLVVRGEAASYDTDACAPVIIWRPEDRLDVQINGFYLPAGLYVGLTEYGAKALVKPTPHRLDYWLWLRVRGRMQTTCRSRHHISDVRQGATLLFPCMLPSPNIVGEHASRITLVLCREQLERQLALMLGRPCDAAFDPPLQFATVLDLTRGHARSITRVARLSVTDFKQSGPMTSNPLTMASLEDFIVNELLLSHPHSYSDALYGSTPSIAPRDVKRAIDFIEANLQSSISLADVIGSVGVPARTLFKHFAGYQGMSPMQYLRAARFDKVLEVLLREMRLTLSPTLRWRGASAIPAAFRSNTGGDTASGLHKASGDRTSDDRMAVAIAITQYDVDPRRETLCPTRSRTARQRYAVAATRIAPLFQSLIGSAHGVMWLVSDISDSGARWCYRRPTHLVVGPPATRARQRLLESSRERGTDQCRNNWDLYAVVDLQGHNVGDAINVSNVMRPKTFKIALANPRHRFVQRAQGEVSGTVG